MKRDPDCTLCPLHEVSQGVCLPGLGEFRNTARHDVMVIGGKVNLSPIAQGFLKRVLHETAGLDPDDIWYTSTVKCAVPDGRDIKPRELKTCGASYLTTEIEKVKPQFILLMGNEAMLAVTKRSGIMKYRGNIWELPVAPGHTATCMVVLNPAAVLRNPKWAAAYGMDMARFGRTVRGEDKSPETEVTIVNSKEKLRWLLGKLATVEIISWDIETFTAPADAPYESTNFQEWQSGSSVPSIAFTWKAGQAAVVPIHHPQSRFSDKELVLRLLKPYMQRQDAVYIGHNGKFDARYMSGVSDWHVPQTFDTMLAAHMLDENRQKGLKPLAQSILGADGYDIGEELADATQVEIKKLCTYNGKDTDYTFRLYREFYPQLLREPRVDNIFKNLMMPASEMLVDVERTGLYMDQERWEDRHDRAIERRDEIHDWIQRKVPPSLQPLNLNSPQQMGRFLFGHLGLPVIEHTKTGAPSTAEASLLRLAKHGKIPLAVIKYRKWAKYLSTYILPLKYKHMSADGRIHSNYLLFGTVTGRLSATGGIHQIPRDKFVRSMIGATPGYTFIQADYSQVELRIAAMLSGEKRMMQQYTVGDDIHMIRAMAITGKPKEKITKEERKKAKSVNFGFIYGMGVPKFVKYAFDNYGVEVTEDEARSIRERFFEDYPALRPWHDKQRRLAVKYGRVVSPIGRIRHLTDVLSVDEGVRAEAQRQAINSPVQSCASDFMLTAMLRLWRKFRTTPEKIRILGTVHDSILFEVKQGLEDKVCAHIKKTMEDMDYIEELYGFRATVPIIADIEVGTHWGETEPWAA